VQDQHQTEETKYVTRTGQGIKVILGLGAAVFVGGLIAEFAADGNIHAIAGGYTAIASAVGIFGWALILWGLGASSFGGHLHYECLIAEIAEIAEIGRHTESRLDRIETKIAEIAELVLNARSELDRKRANTY
jgi:hypothetical protein